MSESNWEQKIAEVIAPGAFRDQVGKTVPVWNADHTKQIGTATVIDEDGALDVLLPDGTYTLDDDVT
jgi:hypothetical protein